MSEEEHVRVRLGTKLRGLWEAAGSNRGLITLALLLAMTVSALEQTVVSTAMTSIIAALKGFELFPWVFSAYLLAATVSTPIYGKLADLLGRKRVLLFGLGLFGLGSMLSGLAQSMPQLIAMRIIQGLGAGAVGPIVLTMLGDMFTLEERARIQGLFSAVWGVSSLAGPTIGGALTDHLSWRWVFFVTVPFSAVSAWILITQVTEKVEGRDREVPPIDWAGAGLLTAGSTTLLLALLHGGAWLMAVSAVLFALFIWCERRAADPILPLDLLATPQIASAIAVSFLIGALMFGIDTYIPLFMQGVKGTRATDAGLTLTPMFLAWAFSAFVAAKVVMTLGFRRTALVGSMLLILGTFFLVLGAIYPARSGPLFLSGMLLAGLGFGHASLCCILGVQHAVAWGRRGVATASVMYFRTMGGALGVGALGASLASALAKRLAAIPGVDATAALRPETHALLAPSVLRQVQEALGLSLRDLFLEMFAVAILVILCSFGLRGGQARSHEDAGTRHEPQEDLSLAVGVEH